MSSKSHGGVADILGKVAMRTIAGTIVLMSVVVLIAKGIDGFPFGVWGLVGAAVLTAVSAGVGQVE
jgi:membrane protein required for beta-lactamase induction